MLLVEYLWICPKLLIVPHDLLIAKLEVYGINEKLLAYLHSYLSNRKQCVLINNVTSDFETIISGVPQGSSVGPILFNYSSHDVLLAH